MVVAEVVVAEVVAEVEVEEVSPQEERAALYPPGRVVTPQDVAELIAFLASEESSGVSGESVKVALGSVW